MTNEQPSGFASGVLDACDMCEHPSHGDSECQVETGYDHLNGSHECGCPGSLARQLADVWDKCVEEVWSLGWLHDYAKSDALARNPYRPE